MVVVKRGELAAEPVTLADIRIGDYVLVRHYSQDAPCRAQAERALPHASCSKAGIAIEASASIITHVEPARALRTTHLQKPDRPAARPDAGQQNQVNCL